MQNITYTPSTNSYGFQPEPFDWHSAFVTTSLVVSVSMLILAHAVMAQGVANDVKRLQQSGRPVHYFGSAGWGFIVLFMGIIGLGAHWVMHHSSFRAAGDGAPRA